MYYFGVKEMNTKQKVAYHGINSNITLISSGEHVSTHFYEVCARVRPYNYQMSVQNFQLEHTKPIFNEKKSVITSSFVHLSYIL